MEAPAVVTLHDAAAEQELAMKHDHAEAAPELDAEFDALAWPAMRRLVAFWSRRGSVAIGLLWLCVLGVGAWSFPNVLAKFKNDLKPIPGSASDTALTTYLAAFNAPSTTELLVALWSAGNITAGPGLAQVTQALSTFASSEQPAGIVMSLTGYATLAPLGYAAAAATFVSPDASTSFVRILLNRAVGSADTFVSDLHDALPSILAASPGISGGLTGSAAQGWEANSAVEADVINSDVITIPVSLAILAFVLGSVRLVLLTLITLACSVTGAFALVFPLAVACPVPSWLSLMIATMIAISFDYSLFLLTFLQQELRKFPGDMPRCVAAMLQSTGHTILVSGGTLASCFLSLAFFPVSMLRYPGIATGIAVVVAVLSNLTLLPSLLLMFPKFFSAAICTCCDAPLARVGAAARGAVPARVRALLDGPPAEGVAADGADGKVTGTAHGAPVWSHRAWHWVALMTHRWRWPLVVVIAVTLAAPFGPRLSSFHYTLSWASTVPKGSQALALSNRLAAAFGAQLNLASTLLAVPIAGGTVLTPAVVAEAQAAVAAVLAQYPDTVASGPVYMNRQNVSLAQLQAAAAASCPAGLACSSGCPVNQCYALQALAADVNGARTAMALQLRPLVDATEPAGIAWSKGVRALLEARTAAAGAPVAWYMVPDSLFLQAEVVEYVYSFFPVLMGATAVIVFGLLGLSFRSVLIPLRAVLTISLMVLAVYGAGAAIFDMGILDPTHSAIFSSKYELMWLIPVLVFPVVVGLGVDYDVFLLTRIEEERYLGWGDESAIVLGLERSGPIISWAGIIMAIAFGGLLKASLPLLNQLSFFIVFGVLIDTFVVRSLLVPAVMHILGAWNWWPCVRRFQPGCKHLPELIATTPAVAASVAAAAGASSDVEAH